LEAVFILLEFPSPSRRIFIGSHSSPPSLVRRIGPSDGRRTLVPEGGDEGPDEELQYVDVAQDLDPSLKGPKANLASEGKPQILNPVF
jgi:hypothetical protein